MPANSEAIRLNLDYYRKQAKALLKGAQAGDGTARERLSRQLAKFDPAAPKLHDAQLTIAREQGFPSWPRFREFVVQSGVDDRSLVAAFIDAATSDLRSAEEILSAHPQIASAGFYADLVLGNWKEVERAVAETPSLAANRSGPQNCEPLVYVCFSRFAGARSSRAGDMAETARTLLRHGADADAVLVLEDFPGNPLSCLYAATGLNNNPALGLALLEAGANPSNSESLYHSTEHAHLACMKLLLRYGAKPAGTNALKHMLDREELEGLQLLLSAGADPNERNDRGETALHWAVWRGRSAAVVAALLDGGVDPNGPTERWPHGLRHGCAEWQAGTRRTAGGAGSRDRCVSPGPLLGRMRDGRSRGTGWSASRAAGDGRAAWKRAHGPRPYDESSHAGGAGAVSRGYAR